MPHAASAATTTDVVAMVMGWLNTDRVANGLVPYREWRALDDLATQRADNVAAAGILSHDVAGGNVGDALDASGIPWEWYGEALGLSRLSLGEDAARQVYDAWMASAPHRDILMSNVDNYVGIGIAQSSDGSTWFSLIATESPDHTAPVAANVSLTRSGTTLTYRWNGHDVALQTNTAGLRGFNVVVQRDSGTWQYLRTGTTATSLSLGNRAHGHWYSFRVRAEDRRGTLSPWTAAIRIWVP
jgi:cysteine-rich secretory family protein